MRGEGALRKGRWREGDEGDYLTRDDTGSGSLLTRIGAVSLITSG